MLRVMGLARVMTLAALVCGCTSPQQAQELAQKAEKKAVPEPMPELVPMPVEKPTCGLDQPGPPVRVAQGIAGVVCFWQGDFMPGDPSGTIRPVARTIEIHAPTRREEAVPGAQAGFWNSVATPLVATAVSRADGWFEVALPPGSYSLFVREAQGLYANGHNEDGVMGPVDVVAGAVARTQLDVDYEAVH